MTRERWLPVVGYDGLYEVSDHGRIKSYHTSNRWPIAPHFMNPSSARTVALVVNLRKNGESKVRLVHHLVMTAFVGPRPEGKECCHNDGNFRNNRLENLRWDTHLANHEDSVRHGTYKLPPGLKGVHAPRAVLSEDDVRCIRAEPNFRGVLTMLSKAFGISNGHVHNIRSGRQMSSVPQWL